MNIAFTRHASAPGTTLTFDIETAVHTLWGGEGDGIKKLRALATLLDIEIPKGLRTIREEKYYYVYDNIGTLVFSDYDDTVNATQMKAAYIADLIEKRVRVLEEDEREARYARANNI
tara:strand:+ start:1100 stop:1450 length:351 start_codon:yes stop_codon:yes gene_type:complete